MLTHSSSPCCQRSCADNTAPLVYYKIITVLFQKATGAWTHWQSELTALDFHLLHGPKRKNAKDNEMTSSPCGVAGSYPCVCVKQALVVSRLLPFFPPLPLFLLHNTAGRGVRRPGLNYTHNTQGRLEILYSTVTGEITGLTDMLTPNTA